MQEYWKEVKKLHKHSDYTLKVRFWFFCATFAAMLGVLAYDMTINEIGFLLALGGIAVGMFMGFMTRKMFYIHWKEKSRKVGASFDFTAIISIGLYIAFALSRRWIFAHWVRAEALTAFVFSTIAGVMLGRIIITFLNFQRVIKHKKSAENL